jgi:hypothetical protein
MNIENITQITATNSGIIEIGSLTIYIDGHELQFDIEEHNIKGNYEFKAFLAFGTDVSSFDIEINHLINQVIDQKFLSFLKEQYSQLSRI